MLIFQDNTITTNSGEQWGTYRPLNPVAGDAIPERVAGHLVVHSGTPADSLFDEHPLSWGERAQTGFHDWCQRACAAGHSLAIRTHARHVLCDTPRCASFAEWAAEHKLPIRIILEPEALFEPAMAEDLEDHVDRMFRLAGQSVAAVMLGATEPAADLAMDALAKAVAGSANRWGFTGDLIAAVEHADAVAAAFAPPAATP